MSVNELSEEQMLQLKQNYICSSRKNVSYGELADADNLVSDSYIEEIYGSTDFVEDDF